MIITENLNENSNIESKLCCCRHALAAWPDELPSGRAFFKVTHITKQNTKKLNMVILASLQAPNIYLHFISYDENDHLHDYHFQFDYLDSF